MTTNQPLKPVEKQINLASMDQTKLTNEVPDELSFISVLASSSIYNASVETAKNIAVWHSLNKEDSNRMIKASIQIAGLEWAKLNHELCSRSNKSDDINRNYIEYALKAMKKHQPN